MERNLSVELRPQKLEEFVGCSVITGPILEGIRQGRIDSTYCFFGPPGCGKTSLARAVAKLINGDIPYCDIVEPDTGDLSANEVRDLIASAQFSPWIGKYKCIILDEAHKISAATQIILLKALEEPCETTVWFVCSSEPSKLSEAIRRRGVNYILPSINDLQDYGVLISRVSDHVKLSDYSNRWVELASELINQGVTSPGLIIRAAEKWITGVTAAEAARVTETTNVDTFAIARAAAAGRWADAQVLLQAAPTSAAKDIRSKVSSYFKSILLKEKAGTDRASRCVWAIQQMAELANQNQFEDGLIWAATCASIYNICIGQRDYILKKGKECIS